MVNNITFSISYGRKHNEHVYSVIHCYLEVLDAENNHVADCNFSAEAQGDDLDQALIRACKNLMDGVVDIQSLQSYGRPYIKPKISSFTASITDADHKYVEIMVETQKPQLPQRIIDEFKRWV